jgi:hypothetical protein
MATSSLRRSPIEATPSSFRSSAVKCGSTSPPMLLSRKLASYWSRPRLRSHPPTSIAALHMAWLDDGSLEVPSPAAWPTLILGLNVSIEYRQGTAGYGASRQFLESTLRGRFRVALTLSVGCFGMAAIWAFPPFAAAPSARLEVLQSRSLALSFGKLLGRRFSPK